MKQPLSLRVVLPRATLQLHVLGTARDDCPALLFLHYFGGSARSWGAVMSLLARRGFCCLAPDIRGFGESAAIKQRARPYNVTTWTEDILELTTFLELRRFVLVGHSMGGKIALSIAARAPVGLEAVVLVAPSPPTPEPMPEKERARLLESYGNEGAAMETLRKITARPLSQKRVALVVEDSLRSSPLAWRAWLTRGSRENISAKLRGINIPVAIAVGAADKTITAELVQREIVGRLPLSAPVHTIARSAHLLPLEAPTATADFINGVVAGGVDPGGRARGSHLASPGSPPPATTRPRDYNIGNNGLRSPLTRSMKTTASLIALLFVAFMARGSAEEPKKQSDMSDKITKTDAEWKKLLTPEQYHILREKGTERPFVNAYNDLHEHGIFKCAACGKELYSSDAKFESGTGWPSFYQPISKDAVTTETDRSFFATRTEVLCERCGGHLGHVFNDGPQPTGLRYCMNSAAMKFEKTN